MINQPMGQMRNYLASRVWKEDNITLLDYLKTLFMVSIQTRCACLFLLGLCFWALVFIYYIYIYYVYIPFGHGIKPGSFYMVLFLFAELIPVSPGYFIVIKGGVKSEILTIY